MPTSLLQEDSVARGESTVRGSHYYWTDLGWGVVSILALSVNYFYVGAPEETTVSLGLA